MRPDCAEKTKEGGRRTREEDEGGKEVVSGEEDSR
jgi:hypothetical protein